MFRKSSDPLISAVGERPVLVILTEPPLCHQAALVRTQLDTCRKLTDAGLDLALVHSDGQHTHEDCWTGSEWLELPLPNRPLALRARFEAGGAPFSATLVDQKGLALLCQPMPIDAPTIAVALRDANSLQTSDRVPDFS